MTKKVIIPLAIAVIVAAGVVIYLMISSSGTNTNTNTTTNTPATSNQASTNTEVTELKQQVSMLEQQVQNLESQVEYYKALKVYLVDSIVTADKKQFSNNEIGIAFQYPKELGSVELTIRPGSDSGNIYYGTFSENENIQFGGIDNEFAEGRSGSLLDNRGYHNENGTYYMKFVSAKPIVDDTYKLVPLEIIPLNGNDVLLLDENSFVNSIGVDGPVLQVGDDNYAALLNLSGPNFPGFAFWDKDTSALSLDQLKEIIKSIELI
ncbi:MAG: hypothetical protein V1838_01445 [Patescibacteria group bacterium]